MYPQKPVRVNDDIFGSIDLSGYVMEPKYDGFRILLYKMNNKFEFYTRDKVSMEITDNLTEELKSSNIPNGTILDGEIWTPSKRGSWRHNKSVICKLTFWDVVSMNFNMTSKKNYNERRNILEDLNLNTSSISIVEKFDANIENERMIRGIATVHKDAGTRSGFIHGVVLKKKYSVRRDHCKKCHEHPDWMKIVYWAQN